MHLIFSQLNKIFCWDITYKLKSLGSDNSKNIGASTRFWYLLHRHVGSAVAQWLSA